MAENHQQKSGLQRPLLFVGASLVTMLTVTVLGYVWWLGDDSDLIAADTEAEGKGLLISWESFRPKSGMEDERLLVWDQLVRLAESITAYGTSECPEDWDEAARGAWDEGMYLYGDFGIRSSEALHWWHAHHVDLHAMKQLDETLDRFGSDEWSIDRPRDFSTLLSSIRTYQQLANLLLERCSATADSAQRRVLLRRYFDLLTSMDPSDGLLKYDIKLSFARRGLEVALQYDLWDEALSNRVLQLLAIDVDQQQRAINAEWLVLRHSIGQLDAEELGLSLPFMGEFLLSFACRRDRKRFLDCYVESWEAVRLNDAELVSWMQSKVVPGICSCGHGHSVFSLEGLIGGMNFTLVNRSALRFRMFATLCLASQGDVAWPDDPWDPMHAPMRKIMDGSDLQGAYSVGDDGVDDGWQDESQVFWFVERPDPGP